MEQRNQNGINDMDYEDEEIGFQIVEIELTPIMEEALESLLST